jgi:hypothetical protein
MDSRDAAHSYSAIAAGSTHKRSPVASITVLSRMSINPTPEELAAIIERLHASNLAKDHQIAAMQAAYETATSELEEQVEAEKDAYEWAYQDY